jgi:hypothetical protein
LVKFLGSSASAQLARRLRPYRGVISNASPANGANYVRVDRHSAVIHLEAISSLVLPD